MMLDISELMIGDWVKTLNNKGEWIDNCKVDLNLLFATENCVAILEPIPLTPEILEKNGFYYGYTSNEEDLASNTIAQLSEEDKGWVWDEGAGSVKVIFPNESDGGEIQICDQCFDRDMTFSFVENIMLHELQHALKMCWIKKEIEL